VSEGGRRDEQSGKSAFLEKKVAERNQPSSGGESSKVKRQREGELGRAAESGFHRGLLDEYGRALNKIIKSWRVRLEGVRRCISGESKKDCSEKKGS